MMRITLKQLEALNHGEKWLGKVKAKWHPRPGLFEEGSAQEIAETLKSNHKDLKSSMSALNFYINRAGKKLGSERKAVLENAKTALRSMFK
jgi:hypothetical protein